MDSHQDAISRLIYAYAEHLDAGNFEAVAALFEGATFRSNRRTEVRHGAAEVLDVYRATVAVYDGSPCTKHVITNLVIDVDPTGMVASARSYFTVLQARPELPLQSIIAGRYHDRFALTAGWRFSDRLILIDLVGDLRFHLKQSMPERDSGIGTRDS